MLLSGDACASFLLKRTTHYTLMEENGMDKETQRRLVYGLLSVILGAIATRLAVYLTNKILGEPDEDEAIV